MLTLTAYGPFALTSIQMVYEFLPEDYVFNYARYKYSKITINHQKAIRHRTMIANQGMENEGFIGDCVVLRNDRVWNSSIKDQPNSDNHAGQDVPPLLISTGDGFPKVITATS